MTITEMLMKNGKAEEAGKMATGTFKSRELARICGIDGAVEVEFTALSPRRVSQYKSMLMSKDGMPSLDKSVDADLFAIVGGVTSPDLKDKALRDKFKCVTPKDLAEKLFGNEISALSDKIYQLSTPGEAESDEELVKN